MRTPSPLRIVLQAALVLTVAHCLRAQTPAASTPELPVKEAQGLPPRVAPTDYQAQGQAGTVTIAAEFTGHGVPTAQGALFSEDYVIVETALYGPAGARLVISGSDFSLRINGKKNPLPSVPYGLVAKNLKDPEWVAPESEAPKSKGGVSSSGGGQQGEPSPPPSTPKVPIELLRSWQQRLQKAVLAKGDRALPQAGLTFYPYHGKADGIHSVELIYEGPAGTATLTLQ